MLARIKNRLRGASTRFSFGSTSAIITNLALMAGLHSETNAKISIIGVILVIALADNIADSFGIHIFQESEKVGSVEIWISTMLNFITRVMVSLSFVALILFMPLDTGICASIAWGLTLLAWISYVIAVDEHENPSLSILTHVLIAVAVIFLSNIVGDALIHRFGR